MDSLGVCRSKNVPSKAGSLCLAPGEHEATSDA
jgi:hypothetical protein